MKGRWTGPLIATGLIVTVLLMLALYWLSPLLQQKYWESRIDVWNDRAPEGFGARVSTQRVESPSLMRALGLTGRWERPIIIEVGDARFSDDDMPPMPIASEIYNLILRDTGITDDAINRMAEYPKLTYVTIVGTPLSSESVATLAGMKDLRQLILVDTGLSEDDLDTIRRALPACYVDDEEPQPRPIALPAYLSPPPGDRDGLQDRPDADQP